MDDIELTRKIENLKWVIDFETNTCKSDLVGFDIIKGDGFYDLQMYWVSPDVPPVVKVLNRIQRSAVKAFNDSLKNDPHIV